MMTLPRTAAIFAALLAAIPISMNNEQLLVFFAPLQVSTPATSPVRSALADLALEPGRDSVWDFRSRAQELRPEDRAQNVVAMIEKSRRERIVGDRAKRLAQTLVLDQAELSARPLRQQMIAGQAYVPQAFRQAKGPGFWQSAGQAVKDEAQDIFADLSAAARRRLIRAQLQDEEMAEPAAPSLHERAHQLVHEQVAEAPSSSIRQVGPVIVMASAETNPDASTAAPTEPPPRSEVGLLAKADTADSTEKGVAKMSEPYDVVENFAAKILHNISVSGKIEMSQGLAYMGPPSELVVYRTFEGVLQEVGYVWVQKGVYEIVLDEAVGTLVAELRDETGFLLGQARYPLGDLTQAVSHQPYLENVDLTLRPVHHVLRGQVASGYLADEKLQLLPEADQALVTVDALAAQFRPMSSGVFEIPQVAMGSQLVLRAQKENYWGSLVVGHSDTLNVLHLFRDQLMAALIEELSGSTADQGLAILIGRVERNGRPVAGAQVELAGWNERPVYFQSALPNAFWPDKKADATGVDGLFAYVGVPPGLHQVRAFFQDNWLPSVVAVAEQKHVSFVRLSVPKSRIIPVRAFAAFDAREELRATVQFAGSPRTHSVAGRGGLEVPIDESLAVVEAEFEAGYEAIRMILPRQLEYLHLPGIATAWLQELLADDESEAARGVVVVFAPAHQALTSKRIEGDASAALDFDEQGVRTQNAQNAHGFVFFNVESGMRTLVVEQSDGVVYTQLVMVDPSAVSVVVLQDR